MKIVCSLELGGQCPEKSKLVKISVGSFCEMKNTLRPFFLAVLEILSYLYLYI